MRTMIAAALACLCMTTPAAAQEREAIGTGRLFTNDIFGDGADRWRTGSYVFSHVRAAEAWEGQPQGFGSILEYRLRGEIIAASGRGRAPGDRPYVGALSVGAHSHFAQGPLEISLGADLQFVGPQTGMAEFQKNFHAALDLPQPRFTDNQVDDAVHVNGTAEITYPLRINDLVTLRPFGELLAGAEDIARVGADIIVGGVAQNDLMLRDVVTGQLYRGTVSDGTGFAFVAGADFAAVDDSAYLPNGDATDTRTRARLGVHWQLDKDVTFFYGATYLSEEFQGQANGQVLGSLKLNFNF